ncbi:MAG: DUF1848 domain-containing protein, partial [Chloroflexi bacterium]|nr:DUF1848 domain-containing protein [Chloroflexota bacterium]
VSLQPHDVEAMVFWTRHPRHLLAHLDELDRRDYCYYFQYTLMDNPRALEPHTPPAETAIRSFRELAQHVGADRVIWRYDPIVFSNATDLEFHTAAYRRLAEALRGCTKRSVISIMDLYGKARPRLLGLAGAGIRVQADEGAVRALTAELAPRLADTAAANGMEIVSCAETLDLRPFGVRPGACVDADYLARVLGVSVAAKKDPAQREACGCVSSRDIGMYDSCLFGCRYCYAVASFLRARANRLAHDPLSPSLLGTP